MNHFYYEIIKSNLNQTEVQLTEYQFSLKICLLVRNHKDQTNIYSHYILATGKEDMKE